MRPLRPIEFCGLALLGLALILFVALGLPAGSLPPEPFYQGKTPSAWALDLIDPSAAVRDHATEVIRGFGPDAVPALVRLLQARDPLLAGPVKALSPHLPLRARNALLRRIDPYATAVRHVSAAQALRIMGPNSRQALPALRTALRDCQGVSWFSALALSQLGEPGIAALIQSLEPSARLKSASLGSVCYALGTAGEFGSTAAPALGRLLGSADRDVQTKAGNALVQIGRPGVPVLTRALGERKSRMTAVQCLATIGTVARESVPALIEITASDLAEERRAALKALAQIRPASTNVVTAQVRALHDPVLSVRLEALHGLSRSPRTAAALAVPEITRLLKDPIPEIRAEAAGLLGEMGNSARPALAALLEASNDPDAAVQIRARQTLEQLGASTSHLNRP